MNEPPTTFVTLCTSAGLSSEEAKEKWLSLWETTIYNFLIWLTQEGILSKEQQAKLDEVLTKATTVANDQNIFSLIEPILTPSQMPSVSKTFAELFTKELNDFNQVMQDKIAKQTQ